MHRRGHESNHICCNCIDHLFNQSIPFLKYIKMVVSRAIGSAAAKPAASLLMGGAATTRATGLSAFNGARNFSATSRASGKVLMCLYEVRIRSPIE